MADFRQEFLAFALARDVLRFGEFVTKAGRKTPYFFNAGLFNDGESLRRLGRFYADALLASGVAFDQLFGPAYKGITLAAATAIALAEKGHNLPFSFNRKEAKDHGEGGVIVGAPLNGRVMIVDDVITDGGAKREAIELIRAHGANPAGVLIAFDRNGARPRRRSPRCRSCEQEFGIPVVAIATLDDLMAFIDVHPALAAAAARWRYREQYGVRDLRRKRLTDTMSRREYGTSKRNAGERARAHGGAARALRGIRRWPRWHGSRAAGAVLAAPWRTRRRTNGSTTRASSTTPTRCRRRPSTRATSMLDKQGSPIKKTDPPLTPEQLRGAGSKRRSERQALAEERDEIRAPGPRAAAVVHQRKAKSTSRGVARSRHDRRADAVGAGVHEQLAKRKEDIVTRKAALRRASPCPPRWSASSRVDDRARASRTDLIAQKQKEADRGQRAVRRRQEALARTSGDRRPKARPLRRRERSRRRPAATEVVARAAATFAGRRPQRA